MSFQQCSRRFVSLFSHFLSGADVAAAPLKSDLTIIAKNSEKGKLLSSSSFGGKNGAFRHG
ncbi:MAG TPA: hypothetical protein VFE60_18380, partial [Roseiarcus sp.]|nr:hypothetical protein [Roseiarcus sp.]